MSCGALEALRTSAAPTPATAIGEAWAQGSYIGGAVGSTEDGEPCKGWLPPSETITKSNNNKNYSKKNTTKQYKKI